jgi:N utilization substance protein B
MNLAKNNLPRVTSRLIALQILYSEGFFEQDLHDFLQKDYLDKYKKGEIFADLIQSDELIIEPDENFLKELLSLTKQNVANIDKYIVEHIRKGWTIERLDPIIRSILRLAVCEMLFFGDIPVKVILDQYVSLAYDFYVAEEVGFVNGVLDTIGKVIRPKTEEQQENKTE